MLATTLLCSLLPIGVGIVCYYWGYSSSNAEYKELLDDNEELKETIRRLHELP